MKRSIISIISILTFCGIGLIASSAMALNGPLANATVSFGQWDPNDPDLLSPLDRLLGDPAGGVGNNHALLPNVAKIKAGGAVNFIISGGHIPTVYDDGTKPEDINTTNIEQDDPATTTVNEACATTAGGVLSDSDGRIYRGPCFVGRRDGVEVVKFSKPGTYLVICARKNHFFNPDTQQFDMFGFVRVLPGKGN